MKGNDTLRQSCICSCTLCGSVFTKHRSDASYCSAAHRQRAYRLRKRERERHEREVASILSRERLPRNVRRNRIGVHETTPAVNQ